MIYLCTAICVVCAMACLGCYQRARRARQAMEVLLGAVLLERLAETVTRDNPSRN